MDPNSAAMLRRLAAQVQSLQQEIINVRTSEARRARSVDEEINAIPGRRIVYTLSGEQSFTIAANDGLRGSPINMLVSQDGPFVMTHYPLVGWTPNLPSTATRFGQWMPIRSYPLPTQQSGMLATSTALATTYESIDISYELSDSGSQRNFQNITVGAGLFSQADNMIPLPVPTLFQPNTTISIVITYNNILFGSQGTATTGGLLHVDLPGYRIVSL